MERALLCPGYPVGTPTALSNPTLQKLGLAGDSLGFPGSSAGKESACNAGDFHRFLDREDSLGEGIDYPLQCLGLPWWLRWEKICL